MMKSKSPLYMLTAVLVAVVASQQPSFAAPASDKTPGVSTRTHARLRARPVRTRIQSLATQWRLPRLQLPNGKTAVSIESRSARIARGTVEHDYLKQLSPNVVEFSISPRYHHLYVRLGNMSYDNWPGANHGLPAHISARRWSTAAAATDRVAVLVQLKTSEMARLRTWIDGGVNTPLECLGMFNYGGGDPWATGRAMSSTCTSWMSYAPIGDNGETLGELAGVGRSNEPNSFVNSLVRRGNDRVHGVAVFNPTVPVGENYDFLDRARWRR